MPASDEFKKALRSGDLPEAFVMAMGKATELNITTKVVKADGTVDEEYNAAQHLETRLDILNGTIENRVGEEFVGTGKYRELQEFHQQQVALGNRKIQENFQSLQELFRLLVTLQQYNRLTNAEQPLDLTFLEVPSQKLPPEKVITTLQEQASILESLQDEGSVAEPAPSPTSEQTATEESTDSPETTEVPPTELIAPPPPGFVQKTTQPDKEKRQAEATPSQPPQTEEANNQFRDAAIATGAVAATTVVAKSLASEPEAKKPDDGEALDFLDSFAALDLDDAPEPLMPVSEVEIDDWETPTEMSPAERLAQTPTDTYIPTLSDFDHDDAAGLDDLLDDDFGDLVEDETPTVDGDNPTESITSESPDEPQPTEAEEAIAFDEAIGAEESTTTVAEDDDFDADELAGGIEDNLNELLVDSFSEDDGVSAAESLEAVSETSDTDNFDSDDLPDFADVDLDELLLDSDDTEDEVIADGSNEAIEGFDDFADFSEDDLPDDVVDDLLHEPDTSDDDGEVTAISFKQNADAAAVPTAENPETDLLEDEESGSPLDDSIDDLLEDEVAIASETEEAVSEVVDLTDISHAQTAGLAAVGEPTTGEITEPQDATTPSEAIADEPAEVVDNELLVAATAMTPEVTEQLLQETFEQPEASVAELVSETAESDSEAVTNADMPDFSDIDDSELLSFIDEDWQSHPDVTEITSLDAETDSEPILLQPLSEEELATLKEVEDTDWLSSTVDDDWKPLNLSGDETNGLESFSLILNDEELTVDAEMNSLVSAEAETATSSVTTEGIDTWHSVGDSITDDASGSFDADGELPEIDLHWGGLDAVEAVEVEESGIADAEDNGAIADDFATEVPEDVGSLETDDLSTVTENIDALELAGTDADLGLDAPLDEENWDEAIAESAIDLLSETSEEVESGVSFDSFEDLDESADLLGEPEVEDTGNLADDGPIDSDGDVFADIEIPDVASLSNDELQTLDLSEEPSLGAIASDDSEDQDLDPFATANLASVDLETLTTEADLDFEAMEEDVDLDLLEDNIGELASPDPLALEDDSLSGLDLDADLTAGTDEFATPVFDIEPDPFAELDLGNEELETANLDDLGALDTTELPDPLDDSSLEGLDLETDVDIATDHSADELETPVFDIEPDPFAELNLDDDDLPTSDLETTDLDSLELPDIDNLTGDRPDTSDEEATADEFNIDDLDLDLDIDGLDNLDLDGTAIASEVDDTEPLQELDVSSELDIDTNVMAEGDEEVALAMDMEELDPEILASLTELDEATQSLETGSLDFGSEALFDDLGNLNEAEEPQDDSLEAASTTLFTDDADGNDLDLESFSLDDIGGLEEDIAISQPSDASDAEDFADLDLNFEETAALSDLTTEEAIAPDSTSGALSADDDWANFDLNLDSDDPLADLSTDDSGGLDDTPIDLDFDLGDLNLPDLDTAEAGDGAIAADNDLDWQQFAISDNETETSSTNEADGWDALGDTDATPETPTAATTSDSNDDDWAIAGLDGLDDLSDNDLSGLGDFDLDALELDDDKNDDSDFDLFGDDESGDLNPFLDPSV